MTFCPKRLIVISVSLQLYSLLILPLCSLYYTSNLYHLVTLHASQTLTT